MTAAGSGSPFVPYYQAFRELERRLAATEWFADGWHTQVGYYGGETPQGVSFRLYKDGWFNDTGGGIHLESWISNAVLLEAAPLMDGWKSYKTSSNSYQTLIRHLPVTPDSLVDELKAEYARLRLLAPIIDQVVRQARPHLSEAK